MGAGILQGKARNRERRVWFLRTSQDPQNGFL